MNTRAIRSPQCCDTRKCFGANNIGGWRYCRILETTYEVDGACPFCKSEDTDYSIKAIKRNYGYGVVWCNSCKKAFFISRIKASNERMINKNIPTDLVY